MKKMILFGCVLLFVFAASLSGSNDPSNVTHQKLIMQNMNLNPLAFTENQGQWDERVKFKADAGGANMWFTEEGVYYQFTRRIAQEESNPDDPFMLPHERFDQEPDSFEQLVIKVSFVGANSNPIMAGEDMMEYKCNYFFGNDPDQWHTDVPNYQVVYYEEIYSGIDLKYYGNGKQMEYDFIVSPGTDYGQIQIQYEGAKSLSVNSSGELVVETEWGSVIEQKPIVYQLDGNKRQGIEGKYAIIDNNTFSFELSDDYNPNHPMVIDPTLVYSTYLGGSNSDRGCGICVDDNGNAYITGATESTDFFTNTLFDYGYRAYNDVFVTKLSADGNSLVYSSYLGGTYRDEGNDICVDINGSAYITGQTQSSDFPTENPFDDSFNGGSDIFVTRLSPAGDSLIYSTYLGGSSDERWPKIAIDEDGNAYMTGQTPSPDYPVVNAYDATHNVADDIFVSKLSASGNSLIYSTYIGASLSDCGRDICVDNAGQACITGWTSSADFPLKNAVDDCMERLTEGFVLKLSSTGDSLIYSTFLGGSKSEEGWGICMDDAGNAYVTGQTASLDFPMVNPYDGIGDDMEIFVSKISTNGDSLIYSTYLGGSRADRGYDICVDDNGNTYVTGETSSLDFPLLSPVQSLAPSANAFVIKINHTGNALIYSTYLGGSGYDFGIGICVDHNGNAYVTGDTQSSDFPIENAYDSSYGGGADAFVAKLPAIDYICGDANHDNIINVSDAVYIINYVFVGGNPPDPLEAGDCNCDAECNVSDAVWIINYIFLSGPVPCEC